MVRGIETGSDDQSRPRTISGKTHERDHGGAGGRSPVSGVSSQRGRRFDPGCGRPGKLGDVMTGISAQNGVITLINVFTVDPVNQRRHIELLTEATDVSVRRAPGFVSAFIAAKTAQGSRCT